MLRTPLSLALIVATVLSPIAPSAVLAQTAKIPLGITTSSSTLELPPGGTIEVALATTGVTATTHLTGTDLAFRTVGPAIVLKGVTTGTFDPNTATTSNLTATPPRVVTYGYDLAANVPSFQTFTFAADTGVAPGSTIVATIDGTASDGSFQSAPIEPLQLTFRIAETPPATDIPPSVTIVPASSLLESSVPPISDPPVTQSPILLVSPTSEAVAGGQDFTVVVSTKGVTSSQHLTGTQLVVHLSHPSLFSLTGVTLGSFPNDDATLVTNIAAAPPTLATYGYDLSTDISELVTLHLHASTMSPSAPSVLATVGVSGIGSDGNYSAFRLALSEASFSINPAPLEPRIDVVIQSDVKLAADGVSAAKVTAQLVNASSTDKGGLANRQIVFESTDANIGVLEPATAQTDVSGLATVSLRSGGAAGAVTVKAIDLSTSVVGYDTTTFFPSSECATPAAIGRFAASPLSVQLGEVTTLSWETTNGQSVVIQNVPLKARLPLSGSIDVIPSTTTTYTLVVEPANAGCPTVTSDVTVAVVEVQPSCTTQPVISSFTATPPVVAPGESSTLAWSVEGADSITITPGALDPRKPVGRLLVTPDATTTHTLSVVPSDPLCKHIEATVTVDVTPPSTNDFTLSVTVPQEGRDPAGIAHGSFATDTLSLRVKGATIPGGSMTWDDLQASDEGTATVTLPNLVIPDGTVLEVSVKTGASLRRTIDGTVQRNAVVINLGNPATYTPHPGSSLNGRLYLPLGDIEGSGVVLHDNVIDSFDTGAWILAFRMQDAASIAQADIDANGAVGSEDLSIILRNYNSRGDD